MSLLKIEISEASQKISQSTQILLKDYLAWILWTASLPNVKLKKKKFFIWHLIKYRFKWIHTDVFSSFEHNQIKPLKNYSKWCRPLWKIWFFSLYTEHKTKLQINRVSIEFRSNHYKNIFLSEAIKT